MSFHMLPPEIVDHVLQNLEPADLSRVSYTASCLYPLAQRQLYRHVSVSPARRNLDVVLTLARKPQLACHVRSFSLDLHSYSSLLQSFYRQLTCALSSMTELTSLHLFVDPNASWILEHIQVPSYSRLLHFACPFPFDSHVAHFLSRTPVLLELEVDSLSCSNVQPTSILTPSSIPCLQRFVGSSQAAEAIIPSRPVHSIHLTAGDFTEGAATRMSESSVAVAVLSATTSSAPGALLHRLSECMQSLMHMRLMTTYSFPDAPDVNFYERIASGLNAFPDLQSFELCGMHWGSQERKEAVTQRVWQSQPTKPEPTTVSDDAVDIDAYSDLFFAY